jgi:hypothetical protein
MITIVFASLLLVLALSAPAHAYLDPGSGSMLLQLILGGVAGLMLAIKIFWRRILALLGIHKKDESGGQEPPAGA